MLNTKVSHSLLALLCALSLQVKSEQAFVMLQPDERKAAIALFNSGQFDKAQPVFSKLSHDFPYDFMSKYYYGACLVETGQYGLDAEKNLTLASTKEVPVKVFYYLGRFYHAGGNWNNAQRYYNRYKNSAEAGDIKDLGIDDLIGLCYGKINPFITETALNESDTDSVISNISGKAVSVELSKPEGTLSGKVGLLPAFINFQINDKVTYLIEEMFQVTEAKVEFRTAAEKERQLDSLLLEVQRLRKLYHNNVNPIIRDSLALEIQNHEYRNLVLNTEVDQHYNQARKLEQEWWKKSDNAVFETFRQMKDSLIRLQTASLLISQAPDSTLFSLPDSLATDSLSLKSRENLQSTELSDEITYRIQIGAYDKGLPTQRKLLFNKLGKIRTIETLKLENGVTVYTTGNLKNMGDALKLQTQIRQEGIKDAFVIMVKDGKRVPLPTENKEIEK
jgi:hypothetical protein